MLPAEFLIQLYNPDQQILVNCRSGSWTSAPYWEFEMPQQSFRQPSNSTLDRTQSDPTASETTPKINFKWKKDGNFSRDLVCSLSGKSTNPDGSKRKNREPDITIALFRHLREITLYEPNLNRVDMEDPKGLEVVLLLSSIVIREVYNGHIREVFNITEAPRELQHGNSPIKSPTACPILGPILAPTSQPPSRRQQQQGLHSHPPQAGSSQRLPLQVQTSTPRPPPTDPRSQWELDAETARLKKQVEREERERRHTEHAETKRVKKMVEAEERRARQKQAEIDQETERLKRAFAEEFRQSQQIHRPPLPSRHDPLQQYSTPNSQVPFQRPQSAQPHFPPRPQQQNPRPPNSTGPYLQPPGIASSSFFNGAPSNTNNGKKVAAKKKSYFGLRSHSDQPHRLNKKQSSVF